MKLFYKWLSEKFTSSHELSYVDEKDFVVNHNSGIIYKGVKSKLSDLPKRLILGYMIDYMIETDGGVSLNIHTNIDDLYNWLEKKINERGR
jgi:hypothetical protein